MIKIVERTHEKLRLQQQDWLLWRLAGVVVVIIAGVSIASMLRLNGQLLIETSPMIAGLLGFSIAVTGVGIWLLVTGGLSVEFNKKNNKMKLHQSGLLPLIHGVSTVECSLGDISDIVLDEAWEAEKTDENGKVITPAHKIYQIMVVLDSGRQIPLPATSGPESLTKAKIVRQVNQFLFHTDYKRNLHKNKPESS